MLEWIAANIATIIIGAVLAVIVFFAIRSVIKSRKSGGCSGCADCAMSSACHQAKVDKK